LKALKAVRAIAIRRKIHAWLRRALEAGGAAPEDVPASVLAPRLNHAFARLRGAGLVGTAPDRKPFVTPEGLRLLSERPEHLTCRMIAERRAFLLLLEGEPGADAAAPDRTGTVGPHPHSEILLTILKTAFSQNPSTLNTLHGPFLARVSALRAANRAAARPLPPEHVLEGLLNSAAETLRKGGLMSKNKSGCYRVTSKGKRVLDAPESLTSRLAAELPDPS
jgi:hypothetical protein